VAHRTWVHVTLGDVSVPCHSGLTTFQCPLDPTVEVCPRRSRDLRPPLLRNFGVRGIHRVTSSFLPEWSACRDDHGLDLMVMGDPDFPQIYGLRHFREFDIRGFYPLNTPFLPE
jgi:hypothetical protein